MSVVNQGELDDDDDDYLSHVLIWEEDLTTTARTSYN